ncbi:PucR family transcriptional regulator [Pectinatus sottacetonis]|uniref:PucR family transcriptional regulator n=1 Tax=Pectinatus sottacetonis TaxID=1002795 RepID=UPI0018C57473|nr:PucR family transcriptional regulator [Pectinatus sottacetonis]
MSIQLKKLFSDTKDSYQLCLLAGAGGLENEITWVQYTEDIATSSFLRGNELIITTGLCCKEEAWLIDFINELVVRKTAGIIINTGKYIKPAALDQQIIKLCDEHNLPLFIMPWRIHLADIMQDYMNRLFLATQKENNVTDHIKTAIFEPELAKDYGKIFDLHEMIKKFFQIILFNMTNIKLTAKLRSEIILHVKNISNKINLPYVIFWHKDQLILLIYSDKEIIVRDLAEKIVIVLHRVGSVNNITCGSSACHNGFIQLVEAYHEAVAASAVANLQKKALLFFADLGVYRVLFATNNIPLLEKIHNDQLGVLLEHDRKHNSQLYATLRIYLFNNNSLKITAEIAFTHRNTINYRMMKARKILACDFDDATIKFNFMLAFYIADYLEIIKRSS